MPDSLYGAIMARLDRLRGEERLVIQSAAVVGTRFPAQTVAALVTPRQSLEVLLGRLEALEFLREVSPPPHWEYAFKHSAVREVAYNMLLLDQRRLDHRRVAGLLAELYRGREAEHLESLAHHCLLGELWSRAVAYLLLAGDQARDLYANADAIDFYKRALALLERVGEESPDEEALPPGEQARNSSRREPELRAGLADVRFRLGEYEVAWKEYDRALALTRGVVDTEAGRADSSTHVASLVRRMARCHAEMGEHERALALLADADAALAECEGAPAAVERSRVARECGWAYYATGRHSDAIGCAEQVLALAERGGAAPERSDGYNLLGLVAKASGQYEEAIGYYSRTLSLARSAGDLLGVGVALNNLGTVYSDQGKLAEAERCYEEAAQIWDRMGDVIQRAQTLNNLGNLDLARGAFAEAERRFGAAHQLFTRARHPMGTAVSLATLGETFLEAGRLGEAVRALEEALRLAESIPVPELIAHVRAVLAQAYLESGRVDLAEELCGAALRQVEQAEETVYAAVQGRLQRVSAMLCFARGDHPSALAELDRARQIFCDAGLPQELGRTCLELARLRRERGDEAEAEALLEEALRLFTRAGAQADLKRAQAIASSRS